MSTPVEVSDLPFLPPREPDSHKGTFGRVLVVAGSRSMSGAAILCGMGALRGGAGLVQVAVPAEILPIVAGHNPCYLTASLVNDSEGKLSGAAEEKVLELAGHSDVLAIGPGLGQSDAITHLIKTVLEKTSIPVILDADGLNALAKLPGLPRRSAPLILTPHPGEFARLRKIEAAAEKEQRERLAIPFAARMNAVLVLKGYQTLVTDGQRYYLNSTGNPGMASGGTGDVLTGLIAALIAQKLSPFEAAQLGVYVHGLAGDLARDRLGEVSLIATDLLDHLAEAFVTSRQLSDQSPF